MTSCHSGVNITATSHCQTCDSGGLFVLRWGFHKSLARKYQNSTCYTMKSAIFLELSKTMKEKKLQSDEKMTDWEYFYLLRGFIWAAEGCQKKKITIAFLWKYTKFMWLCKSKVFHNFFIRVCGWMGTT